MSRALESRQKAKAQADAVARIADARDLLFASEYDHVVNPDGRVPVVEFFDYNCGFCKRAQPAVADLAATDPRARVIYKEFPILGEASVHAARAAIAAKMQGRYMALHDLMMGHRGGLDAATVKRLAGEAGLDVARLERDMADPRVDAELDLNMEVAARLDIRGTPTFIIGDQLVPGAIDRPTMGAMVSEAEQECRACWAGVR